ncbi:GGDEF domain-containing protein [Modestobacter sp. NPDC049651]|uniref:GGDEF domain-containing protein n=1 Tax=unclassified Modestobacter TaxID=2643866 RepID=UPI0033F2C77F
MTAEPEVVDEQRLEAARWRLLATSDSDDVAAFDAELAGVLAAFTHADAPRWLAWAQAFAARSELVSGAPETAAEHVAAARAALDHCGPSAEQALTLAYLAWLEVTADRLDAAMHLAVDASLLADQLGGAEPSRALHQAHHWLSLALTRLDLEELAVAQAVRGRRVAAALPDVADQWQLLRLSAQQHAELAQTVHRRGDAARSRELAEESLRCATAARELPVEPADDEADLLDVVQAWATALAGRLDDALPPLRRVRRHLSGPGASLWLLGYTELALGRLLGRLCDRGAITGTDGPGDRLHGEEAIELLVTASGAFAASGDRRRYRQCLLELGQATAALGMPAEALHWLEAYRAETVRGHQRSRELWAEMFVRRSRLREAERQTAVLRRHALEDPLTGLGNRRSAERRLAELPLDGEPVSLAVIDVDGFKAVNDEHSHVTGDAVLRGVAELLRQSSRTHDEVFRWAGDEFLVLLPDTAETQAVVALERLRAAVAGSDWAALGVPGRITVSIGVATADGGTGARTWRDLFDRADLQLFTAKRAGRDRVRAAGGASASTAPRAAVRSTSATVDEMVADMLGGGAGRRPGWAFEDGEVAS